MYIQGSINICVLQIHQIPIKNTNAKSKRTVSCVFHEFYFSALCLWLIFLNLSTVSIKGDVQNNDGTTRLTGQFIIYHTFSHNIFMLFFSFHFSFFARPIRYSFGNENKTHTNTHRHTHKRKKNTIQLGNFSLCSMCWCWCN